MLCLDCVVNNTLLFLIILFDLYADFGPLFRTTDADEIKSKIADIKPDGGGDTPEMSLSGLQVSTTKNDIVTFMWISLKKQNKAFASCSWL